MKKFLVILFAFLMFFSTISLASCGCNSDSSRTDTGIED